MRISDWTSDVCSSDLLVARPLQSAFDRGHVVAVVHGLHVPAVGGEARRAVLGKGDVGTRCERHAVVVVEHVELAQLQVPGQRRGLGGDRSEEHTSELQSLMRISYAVFCLKKKKTTTRQTKSKTINTSSI